MRLETKARKLIKFIIVLNNIRLFLPVLMNLNINHFFFHLNFETKKKQKQTKRVFFNYFLF